MKFIDRTNEQKRLHRALKDKNKKFIVVYGRRRLGKSTLIKKMLGPEDVYYEAEKNESAIQMALLSVAISSIYKDFDRATYDSWESLLLHFNMICADNSTLVLDEFPYLVEKTPSLPSTLQRLLDGGKLRFNLIICGSSQRMMQKIILDASEPLYGRADEKINLSPISLKYWQEETNMSASASIEEYSVWGGVPRYWALRQNYGNLKEAIEYLILDKDGLLFDEPAALFMDDTMEIAPYSSIMTAIGNGNTRFSKVANAVGKKTTELSRPLRNLIEMKYLRREVPFGENENKTKKTLYKIDDPFMAFYYMFVAPNKSILSLGKKRQIIDIVNNRFPNLVGPIWERLCQIAVSGNSLYGKEWNLARRWWGAAPVYMQNKKTPVGGTDIEIDVVAESLDGKALLVGECKWNQADYANRLLEKLKVKTQSALFAKDKEIVYVLFLREKPLDKIPAHILLPEDVINLL